MYNLKSMNNERLSQSFGWNSMKCWFLVIPIASLFVSSLAAGIAIPNEEAVQPDYLTSEDLELIEKSLNKKNLKEGKALYGQACFACHGHKLEGATGPNLVDGEWLHGGRPSNLYQSISKGFSEKGMMAFDTMYSSKQRENLVAYLLSKSSGLKDLEFELRPGAEGLESGLSQEMYKTGPMPQQLLHFDMMESEEPAVISFIGKIFFSSKVNFGLLVTANSDLRITMANDILMENLNGEGTDFTDQTRRSCGAGWFPFRIDYLYRGKSSKITATVSPRKLDKLELSLDTKKLKTPKFYESIDEMARVVRFHFKDLPPMSLAVGVPGGKHYAMLDAELGGLLSVWKGEKFVETSGQRNKRAGNPAILGNKPVFSSEEGVYLWDAKNDTPLEYIAYDVDEQVVFHYEHKGVGISITPQLKGKTFGMAFEFKDPLKSPLVLKLGESKLKVNGGTVKDGLVHLPQGHSNSLSLSL
mgnify:CR=1 FL=1|tara:strand:+ start:5421 stop:6833 length:1413 start_codon:yes stop_codon:yes gene_type:complete